MQIIDTVGGLIAGTDEGDGAGGRAASDRAEEIQQSVERLLAARVGPGKAVVEVAVDLVTEREQITERTFDPAGPRRHLVRDRGTQPAGHRTRRRT